ncbi:hypothetical protein RHRU231_560070 [Rhodococcus ruber]|uniref:Uncharacterized protein n=1 Tax=Rhodococcus ruber TaxID=1830 RepID=A0A098BQ16_9NOCA|nr:hypothetical protein RHRU231_560070 [Rhodococcus ruber]
MATRTEVLFSPMVGFSFCVALCCRLLGGDQFVEPADLALTGLEAELMKLTGVAIQRPAGPSDCVAEPFPALLDLAAPALEDPHPRLGGGAAEEGEVHAETVVGVVLRTGVGHQLGEALAPLRSELVHATRSSLDGAGWSCVLLDESVGLHPSQRRIEGTVGEGAERAEQPGQSFAELVAVHGRLEEQPENCQLEQEASSTVSSNYPSDAITDYIAPIYRTITDSSACNNG